ncbi:MAG: 2Fe-2S iron-sulfur cluster-binding protein, partial [Stappiaceae bacterium]
MATTKVGAKPANGADWAQRIRLISGLILMTFATMHFLNHAIGIYSLDAMQQAMKWRLAIWRSPPGTILLYGALLLHAGLALYKTAARRTWRIPPWEALQILLGIAIPYYLFLHIVGTRGLGEVFDIRISYQNVLSLLWPGLALQQSILMLIVWLHGIIGIHFWLRIHSWYRSVFPWLMFAAITVPLLAQWGWIEAARRMVLNGKTERFLTREHIVWANEVISNGTAVMIFLLSLCVAAMAVNVMRTFISNRVTIRYPGDRKLKISPGATLLEVSRANNIPHASVCGGRARCSTCRTRILEGINTLPPPSEREQAVLKRIGADENVRLACQIKPTQPLAVQPLMPGRQSPGTTSTQSDAYHWGVEQPAAIMF